MLDNLCFEYYLTKDQNVIILEINSYTLRSLNCFQSLVDNINLKSIEETVGMKRQAVSTPEIGNLIKNQEHYLVTNIYESIKALLQILLPQKQIYSIHDLLNYQHFYDFLIAIVPQEVENIVSIQLSNEEEQDNYDQLNIQNFIKIKDFMIEIFDRLSLKGKEWPNNNQICKMIKEKNFDTIQILLGNLFIILTLNQHAVMTITTLNSFHQHKLQQFIILSQEDTQNNSPRYSGKKQQSFEDHKNQQLIQQLEHLQNSLTHKQAQLLNCKNQIAALKEQNEDFRKNLQEKDHQINIFRKKLLGYQEIDLLLTEKDNQIQKLQNKINNLEYKSKQLQNQLSQKNNQINEKTHNLQSKYNQMQTKYTKITQLLQEMKHQDQSKEVANKKVINNLKEKVNQLKTKNSQQQNQLLQLIQDKQIKQKQYQEIISKYENQSLRYDEDSFRGDSTTRGKKAHNLNEELNQLSGYNNTIHEQEKECENQQCVQIRSQYFTMISKIVSSLNLPESANCRAIHQKTSYLKNYSTKLLEMSQENQRLKEKIVGSDTQQVLKLKKKIMVLKKRLKDEQSKKKEQLDVLVAVMQDLVQYKPLHL